MNAEIKFDLKNYKGNILRCNNEEIVNVQINEKIYKVNINIFNLFASTILNANNEIKYLGEEARDYRGVICQSKYKEYKILIKKDEKICIFLKKINFKLDIKEVTILAEKIYEFYEKMYDFNFSIRDIDPMYLSNFLWKCLDSIYNSKIDEVMIDELFVKYQGEKTKIIKTAYYKALEERKEIYIPTVYNTNHINVSNYKRICDVFHIIKEHNYPFNNQYIIVYNDELEIRDGQHRASSLRYLYGNIRIPIMRLYFDETKVNTLCNK